MVLQLLGPNINQAMKKFNGALDPGTISDIGI